MASEKFLKKMYEYYKVIDQGSRLEWRFIYLHKNVTNVSYVGIASHRYFILIKNSKF